MISLLAAASILIADPAQATLSPADAFDLSCAESTRWLTAHAPNEADSLRAFALSAFFLGRLSGRNPDVDWRQRFDSDAKSLPNDVAWHTKIASECLPLLRSMIPLPPNSN